MLNKFIAGLNAKWVSETIIRFEEYAGSLEKAMLAIYRDHGEKIFSQQFMEIYQQKIGDKDILQFFQEHKANLEQTLEKNHLTPTETQERRDKLAYKNLIITILEELQVIRDGGYISSLVFSAVETVDEAIEDLERHDFFNATDKLLVGNLKANLFRDKLLSKIFDTQDFNVFRDQVDEIIPSSIQELEMLYQGMDRFLSKHFRKEHIVHNALIEVRKKCELDNPAKAVHYGMENIMKIFSDELARDLYTIYPVVEIADGLLRNYLASRKKAVPSDLTRVPLQ